MRLRLVREALVCWTYEVSLVMILRDAADTNDNASLLEQAGAGTMTAQPPGAANAAVALAQMHNWDSDFVSIDRERSMPTNQNYTHLRPRMCFQTQIINATCRPGSNYRQYGQPSTKIPSLPSNLHAHANYCLQFYSLLGADILLYLLFSGAATASKNHASPLWAKVLERANTNAENLETFRPRSFPED